MTGRHGIDIRKGFGKSISYDVGDLRPAQDGDEGPGGIAQRPSQVLELFLHQEAGGALGNEAGDACGGGVEMLGTNRRLRRIASV